MRISTGLFKKSFLLASILILIALNVCSEATAASVTLTSVTPSSGQPGITNITLLGSGFPTGTITPATVTVTLTPTAGGSAITFPASTVTKVAGTEYKVGFMVPSTVSVSSPTNYSLSISINTGANSPTTGSNTIPFAIAPLPTVSLSPGSGFTGQSMNVTITGLNTNFSPGITAANFGPGISVGGGAEGGWAYITVSSLTSASTTINVDPLATIGPRTISVQTGTQLATVTFTVNSALPTYSVTYNGNGTTGGTAPVDPNSPYVSGSTVTVLGAGTLVKSGFTFAGWNTAANGSGTSYAAGATFAIGAATTLYAQWTALPTYSVTYNGNGTTGGTAPVDPNSPYVSGSTVTVLGAGTLVNTGYTFAGWNTAANGSGTSYAAGATFAIGAATTLYAQWAAQQAPVLSVPSPLSLGSIPVGTTTSQSLTISNTGNSSLAISNITSSGAPFSVYPPTSFSIDPGASRTVAIGFAPTNPVLYTGSVTVSSSSPGVAPAQVTVTGTGTAVAGTPGISAPSAVQFGSVMIGQTSANSVTVSDVSQSAPLVITGATISGAGFGWGQNGAPALPLTVTSGQPVSLGLQFTPGSGTGGTTLGGTLTLVSNDPNRPSLPIALSGNSVAPVQQQTLTVLGAQVVNGTTVNQITAASCPAVAGVATFGPGSLGSDTFTVTLTDQTGASVVSGSANASQGSGTANFSGVAACGLKDGIIALTVNVTRGTNSLNPMTGTPASKNTGNAGSIVITPPLPSATVFSTISVCGTAPAGNYVQIGGGSGAASLQLGLTQTSFCITVPLQPNTTNTLTATGTNTTNGVVVTATPVQVTQINPSSVLIATASSRPLTPTEITTLVNNGVINLNDPSNFNVSMFTIVLTIGQFPVTISQPVVVNSTPGSVSYGNFASSSESGGGGGGGGGGVVDTGSGTTQVVVITTPTGETIPGVIVIDGQVKTLKEFFQVTLAIQNTTSDFNLTDMVANIDVPSGLTPVNAGLGTNVADISSTSAVGSVNLGTIAPQQTGVGQFIVRGDGIGTYPVAVDFQGFLSGGGLTAPFPVSGSASTSVQVYGPPNLAITVSYPGNPSSSANDVTAGQIYTLTVSVTDTSPVPALYSSLDLLVGQGSVLVDQNGNPLPGSSTSVNLGNIQPGQTITQAFQVKSLLTGKVIACQAVTSQNVTLNVDTGLGSCSIANSIPADFVFPPANAPPTIMAINPLNNHPNLPVTSSFMAILTPQAGCLSPDTWTNVVTGPIDPNDASKGIQVLSASLASAGTFYVEELDTQGNPVRHIPTDLTVTAGVSGNTSIAVLRLGLPASVTGSASQFFLDSNATYRATLVGGSAGICNSNIPSVTMANSYQWTASTTTVCSGATQTATLGQPANGSSGQPVNQPIVINFSQPMDPTTFSFNQATPLTSSFVVLSGGTVVNGDVVGGTVVPGSASFSGLFQTFTYTPTGNLPAGQPITIRLTNSLKDSCGDALQAPANGVLLLGFSTAQPSVTPPSAPLVNPLPALTDLASIQVSGTAQAGSTVTITGGAAPATATVNSNGLFSALVSLNPNAANDFTVTDTDAFGNVSPVTTVDKNGTLLAVAEDSTPPTVVSVTPTAGATGVSLTTTVSVTFSKAINSGTVNSGNFSLNCGNGALAGSFALNGSNGFTFTPANPLSYNNSCTIALQAGGVSDLAGNSLASKYSSSFATVAATNPTVTATAGTPQSATINTSFATKLQATVKDSGGNPLNGAIVTFTAPGSGASGSFAGGVTTAISNASGVATSALFTANATAGSYTVTASVTGAATPASFALTNLPQIAANITATAGTPQSAIINTAFTTNLQATVTDSGGNPVNGVTVTFAAPGSGASGLFTGGITSITATTNSQGQAFTSFSANPTVGGYTVTASVAGVATPASFNLTNTPGTPSAIITTSGSNQSATINTAFGQQFVATVKDSGGNLLNGITVTFTAPAGGQSGTFANGTSTTTATTNAQGQATSSAFTANGTLGSYNVQATVNGLQATANFSLTNTQPIISSLVPNSGTLNQTISVLITGQNTHFVNGTTTAYFGTGITVNSVAVSTSTSATATITISPTTTLGSRTVTLTTGGEVASFTNGFNVTQGSAAIASVLPNQGAQGQQVTVAVVGSNSNFQQGVTSANFGPNIGINAVTVTDLTHATVNISIGANASLGAQAVTLSTGGEVASLAGGFSIVAGTPQIITVNPASGNQGDTADSVILGGQNTHWVQGNTSASFGQGITVTSLTVASPTSATAVIAIAPTAQVGNRTVTLTTGSEIASSSAAAYQVAAGIPAVTLSSTNAVAGTSPTITINGAFTNFTQGVTTVSFGSGITVGTVTVNGPLQASVPIQIGSTATLGLHTVTITTGTQVVQTELTVIAGTPVITSITPNTGAPNTSPTVTVTGSFTNWVNQTTVASFGPGISVGGGSAGQPGPVVVTGPNSFTATLAIQSGASIGPHSVTVTTNSEQEIAVNGYTLINCSTTAPTMIGTNPAANTTGVPLNAAVQVEFNAPIDRTTLNGADFILHDTVTGLNVAASVSVDASGRIITLTPSQLLAVNRQYYMQWGNIDNTDLLKDSCGNQLATQYSYFTTGYSADVTGPALVSTSPMNGDTNVPENTQVVLQFSEPINQFTPASGLTVTTAGTTVPGTFSFSPDYSQVTFTPGSALQAATTYTVSYTQALQDDGGNPLTNQGSFSFTTGSATDSVNGTVTATNPVNSETGVGINVTPTVHFSKIVDPLTITSSNFRISDVSGHSVPATLSVSPDRLSATLTPAQPLLVNSQYTLYLNYNNPYVLDLAGNYFNSYYIRFTTGSGAITTGPSVTLASPPNGTSAAPVNSQINVVLSGVIDPTTVGTNAITLSAGGVNVAGTLTVASGNQGLSFVPTAPLAPSTTYTLTVGEFSDPEGNAVTPYTSSFSTGASTVALSGTFYVASVTPANGSTITNNSQPVVITFQRPINPATANNIMVRNESSGYYTIPGTWAVSGATATFTPVSPYPANAVIQVWTQDSVQDLAGNTDSAYVVTVFTAAATADTTAPVVTSVSPVGGATGIGVNTPITLSFSKPINQGTVNSNSVQLFNGDTYIGTGGFTFSSNNQSVTFTQTLPAAAQITLVVTQAVQDLSGNALQPFQSQFTTAAAIPTTTPQVVTILPGPGATDIAPGGVITLFTNNSPLNPATVPGALFVSQNGVLVSGTIKLTANNQAIQFTPSAPFSYGALVQIQLQSTAQDIYGNAVQAFSSQFTMQGNPASTAPLLIASSPVFYSSTITAPLNVIPQYEFDQALLASSVNSNSVRVYNPCTGQAVAGTASLTGSGNNVVQFTPSPNLSTDCTYYYFQMNNFGGGTITNTDGIAAPSESAYFYVGTSSNNTPPTVLSVAPANGVTGVGVNGLVVVTFSAPVNPISVNSSTVQLTGASQTVVPVSVSFNASNTVVTLTPQAPLPASTLMTVTINGVTDPEGNAVANTTSTFSTGAAPDTTQPTVINSSPTANQLNVPTNTAVVIQFSKQMAASTITTNSFYLHDTVSNQNVSATISISADARTATLVPSAPLAIDRQFYFYWTSAITDLTGNPLQTGYIYFTTASSASTTIPAVTGINPSAGLTEIPINATVQVQFNEPIQPTSLGQVSITAVGVQIPAGTSLSNGDQQLIITPATPLQPNTTYLVTVANIQDFAGHVIAQPYTSSFQTGVSSDIVNGSVTATEPVSGAIGIGTNITPTVHFSKVISAISVSNANFYLRDNSTNAIVAATPSVSPDNLSATLTPAQPLQPNTTYYVLLNYASPYITDLAGNYINSTYYGFTTGSGSITTGPSVAQVSPPNATTSAPVNTEVQVVLTGAIDPTTVGQNAITVSSGGTGVPGSVTVAGGNQGLSFIPAASLAPSTTYTVTVAGFKDPEGNAVVPSVSTFTTAASGTAVTGTFYAASVTPANGSTLSNNSQQIVITFQRLINPATVNNILVRDQSNGYLRIAGSWTVNGATATFTPLSPYPANATIQVWTQDAVQDLAGNTDSAYVVTTFNAGSAVDSSPLTVLSVTPTNGTTGVGQNPTVVLTFSKSLNPNTVTNQTIQLFSGDTSLNVSPSISTDNRTVTLTPSSLPANTVITLAATSSVQDLSGNPLTTFQSQFTTGTVIPPQNQGPQVAGIRPGNGATDIPQNSVITLFTSGSPLNASTVQSALHVSQNGTVFNGTTTINANGAIEFTPSSNFTYGALISIYLDQTAQDIYGNPFVSTYSSSFTIQGDPASVAPQLIASNPVFYSSTITAPLNVIPQYEFDQALLASSVNSNSVRVYNPCTGLAVPGTASLTGSGNNVVQFKPQPNLSTGCTYYYFQMNYGGGNNVTNTGGIAAPGESSYFYVGTTTNTTNPTVVAVGPQNNATGVGVNANIYVQFSAPINPISVNGTTIQVSGGSQTVVPYSISFNTPTGFTTPTNTVVAITPLAPLPPNTLMTITINEVTDGEGNPVTATTSQFTTGSGVDLTTPTVVAVSPAANDTIPTNTGAFTVEFSEPMDPFSVNTSTMYVHDQNTGTNIAVNPIITASPDGKTFTLTPNGPLTAGHSVYLQVNGSWNLAGSSVGSSYWYYTIGTGPDTTAPAVTEVNPIANLSNVPTNAPVQIEFSKEIAATSLSGVQLLQGGTPVPATLSLSRANTVVTLTPVNVLNANTTYTISVSGVLDVQGTAMSATYTSTFTTGVGPNLIQPTVVTFTPASGTIDVSDSVAPQIQFSAPMDPLSCDYNTSNGYGIQLLLNATSIPVPTINSVSADGTTVTLTPTTALTSGTVYRIQVYYYNAFGAYVTDVAGNTLQSSNYTATFTAQ